MKISLYHKVFVSSLLSLSFACSRDAKAPKLPVVVAPAPGLPEIQDNVFALSGGKEDVSYKSTLLILNPKANPDQLKDVILASENARLKAADLKLFAGSTKGFDRLYGDNGSYPLETQKLSEALQVFLDEAVRQNSEKEVLSARWVSDQIELYSIAPETRQQFSLNFDEYCEAKIFELALHPSFARYSDRSQTLHFKTRPSPSPFCEAYYQARGYFQTDSCRTGDDAFACLWQGGVLSAMKTELSEELTALASKVRIVLSDDSKRENLRKLLLADPEISKVFLGTPNSIAKSELYEKKRFFFSAGLGKAVGGSAESCKKLFLAEYRDFDFLCEQLSKSLGSRKPDVIMQDVESNKSLSNLDPNSQELALLSEAIQYLSKRPFDKTPQVSFFDFYFQTFTEKSPLMKPNPEKLGVLASRIPEITKLLNEVVFRLSPQDKLEKSRLEQEIKDRIAFLDAQKLEFKRLSNATNDALKEGIRAANAGDVAFGFLSYVFTVQHFAQYMEFRLSFEGFPLQQFQACFDKVKEESMPCPSRPEALADVTWHSAKIDFQKKLGRIDFTMDVLDPESLGLGVVPKKEDGSDYFMQLKLQDLQSFSLKLELFPNRLLKAQDILTGKALFLKDGKSLYEAGISMWEEL